MHSIRPKLSSTQCPDFRTWVPDSFPEFLTELEHIKAPCEGENPAILFRGQRNFTWSLDSSLVRNFIQYFFKIPEGQELPERTLMFHQILTDFIFAKFGGIPRSSARVQALLRILSDKDGQVLRGPNRDLLDLEMAKDIDPWFEMIRDFQQFPEKDYSLIKGTFWLDWSTCPCVALYFAVYDGMGNERKISENHGAVWIFDAASTGPIQQKRKAVDILPLMNTDAFYNALTSMPLMFHPPTQLEIPRIKNQRAVYLAQMDYRYDLATIWANHETESGEKVFVRLILKDNLKIEAAKYLETKGITEEFIYPPEPPTKNPL